jgi:hypothetical protein
MSAGGLVGMVMNFIMFSVFSMILGKAFDLFITSVNAYNGLPMDAINTISQMHLIYIAGPFLYLLALGYNHLVTSNSENNMEV